MLPFANETVTLYNRKEVKDTNGRKVTTWQRRVLHNCFWMSKTVRSFIDGAVLLGSTIKCRIPESLDFVTPEAWDALEDTSGHFTLYVGDIIVHGEVTDEISEELTEIALKQKYSKAGCMTVVVAKNFAFQGSPVKHYAAEGV